MDVCDDDIVGFCFLPSGPELISDFLAKKVVGLPLSRNIIHDDIDIYLYHPDQLPIPNCEDRDWAYFFLFRTPEEEEEEEEFRPTPYGYWEEIKSEKEYNYESWKRAIGFRKTFAFYEGEAPNGKMTDWRMKEYRLNRELSVFKNPKDPKVRRNLVFLRKCSSGSCMPQMHRRFCTTAKNSARATKTANKMGILSTYITNLAPV